VILSVNERSSARATLATGPVIEVMVEGHNTARGQVIGRSSQNKTVNFTVTHPILAGDGQLPQVRITQTFPNSLAGEAVVVQ